MGHQGLVSRMGGSQGDNLGIAISESRIITEAMKQGIDQSALPDMFKGMTALMTSMGGTRRGSADRDAMQMMLEFNKMGFDIRDPRTMGIMQSVQSGLTNPSSPFGQAMSYSVLRGNDPNASFLDLMIQRQRGGSEFAGQMVGSISDMVGGQEDLAVPMIAQMFGLSGNLDAARDIFRNKGTLGSLTGTQMAHADEEGIAQLARQMTPEMERIQASITNSFVAGATEGVTAITVMFKDRMTKMIDVMVDEQIAKLKRTMGLTGKVPAKNGN
jgi:hypothetical protein